eukprot:m.33286 g.33286  ORF g.33286 m.33286 type:complete len:777 (+) comp10343_c0_seq1:101-2431(+)
MASIAGVVVGIMICCVLRCSASPTSTGREYTRHTNEFCHGGDTLHESNVSQAVCQQLCDQLLCACYCSVDHDKPQGSCRIKNGSTTLARSAEGYIAFVPVGPPPPPSPSPSPPPTAWSQLWLRYDKLAEIPSPAIVQIVVSQPPTAVLGSAVAEAKRGLAGLQGLASPPALVVGEQPTGPCLLLRHSNVSRGRASDSVPGTFCLEAQTVAGQACTVVTADSNQGLLYGVFSFLERLRLAHQPLSIDDAPVCDGPALRLRMWDLWDNQDGSVERGYAGKSIFQWDKLPALFPRYTDYARLLASVGINYIVWNNVNACGNGNQNMLKSDYLKRLSPLMALFADWGIRSGFSPCFAAPIMVGGLKTADPLEPAVQQWWAAKAKEIYSLAPSFSLFLVKSDTEGAPGPAAYNRTELQGANMLGEALGQVHALCVWRSFTHPPGSMGLQPEFQYELYHPFNGKTRPNVVLQIKNGPYDFQIREPVHALFGRMDRTNVMLEVEATQEYTGQAKHLVNLVDQWKYYLDFKLNDAGSTLRDVVSGALYDYAFSGAAAVSNLGDDPSWTGHPLSAVNTFGFGRLAWAPSTPARDVVASWSQLTFGYTQNKTVVNTVTDLLHGSWLIYENYTSPMGIGFVCNGNHYDMDMPHREVTTNASATHVGYERGQRYGMLYNGSVGEALADPHRCPLELLLFFHNVNYNRTFSELGGVSLFDWLIQSHEQGAAQAAALVSRWDTLGDTKASGIDPAVFQAVRSRLVTGAADAATFAKSIINYFYKITNRRI